MITINRLTFSTFDYPEGSFLGREIPKGYAIIPFDSLIREGDLFYNQLDTEWISIDPSCFGKMVFEFSPSVIVIPI